MSTPKKFNLQNLGTRYLFCNIGWMNKYQGLVDLQGNTTDVIYNGGKYIEENQTGGEIFNFYKQNTELLHGWVRTGGQNADFDFQRLGLIDENNQPLEIGVCALPEDAQNEYEDGDGDGDEDEPVTIYSADGFTIIWTATKPEVGGTKIIGYFRNATLYEVGQPYPSLLQTPLQRRNKAYTVYQITCAQKDAFLIKPSERNFAVPRQQRGFMGINNVWYADGGQYHNQPQVMDPLHDYLQKVDEYLTSL